LIACNSSGTDETTTTIDPYQVGNTVPEPVPGQEEYWANENLDLPRVGTLLENSDDPADFERSLNSPDGINNLDLNGDGYVDYVSVEEYGSGYDDERGLALYTRFGPDLIQEIANIRFNRPDYNSPGARIVINGNQQLYGDDRYYETNWVDRTVGIVSALFGSRDMYRSPYYYNNYPDYYNPYEVVQPAVYVSRVQRLYPTPVFIQATGPWVKQAKIKSPYQGRWMKNVYAKLANPSSEQKEFFKNNPHKPGFVKNNQGKKNDPPGYAYGRDHEKQSGPPVKFEKGNMKPAKADNAGPPSVKPPKAEKQNQKAPKSQGGGNGHGKGKKG